MITENGMSPRPLTPYDTGEVLEPHLWIHPGIEHDPTDPGARAVYGKVDFDTDDGFTPATIRITRNPSDNSPRYTIAIAGNPDDFTITFTD